MRVFWSLRFTEFQPQYRLKRNKRKAADDQAGAAAGQQDSDSVSYPLVEITEVMLPNNALKDLAR